MLRAFALVCLFAVPLTMNYAAAEPDGTLVHGCEAVANDDPEIDAGLCHRTYRVEDSSGTCDDRGGAGFESTVLATFLTAAAGPLGMWNSARASRSCTTWNPTQNASADYSRTSNLSVEADAAHETPLFLRAMASWQADREAAARECTLSVVTENNATGSPTYRQACPVYVEPR